MNGNGFTLIELMVIIAIIAIGTSIALPSYNASVANAKVQGTAESILAGLRDARSSAIQRNAPVRFQLVTTLDNTCALSTTSAEWVTTETDQNQIGNPIGACAMGPWSPNYPCVDAGVHLCVSDPFIISKSSTRPESGVVVAADNPLVLFSPLGIPTPDALTGQAASTSQITVSSTLSGTRSLRVKIDPTTGSVKLCNLGATAGSANGC